MGKTRFLLTAALLLSISALAKDLETANGITYKDVTIAETTPIGVSFISGGKGGWLDFRDMTEPEQKEYGYDRAKADEFEQKLVKNQGNMVPPDGAPDMDNIPPEANLDPGTVPQTPANTTIISSGQQVTYDPTYFQSAAPVYYNGWVSWNGKHYPYYWWHHWYWHHHWVYHDGRYYPWHYYHNHGIWYHGKYYPYHHGVLAEKDRCLSKEEHNMVQHPHPEVKDVKSHTPHSKPEEDRK